jgi:hypothetical protein
MSRGTSSLHSIDQVGLELVQKPGCLTAFSTVEQGKAIPLSGLRVGSYKPSLSGITTAYYTTLPGRVKCRKARKLGAFTTSLQVITHPVSARSSPDAP